MWVIDFRFSVRALVFAASCLILAAAPPVAATPPEAPYERLERRASEAGAAAVRREYRRLTDEALTRLREGAGPGSEVATTYRRSLDRVWLFEIVHSWARTEARDVWLGRSDRAVAAEIASELIDCLGQGHDGLESSPVASFENDRRVALRQVALLAKLGNQRAALEQVFAWSAGKIDTCASAEEFAAFPHDWPAITGVPAASKPAEPRVSAAAETAVRLLVEEYFGALARGDAKALANCWADLAVGRATAARLVGAAIGPVDLSQARFAFDPRRTGALAVTVTDLRAGGQVGAKRFEIEVEGDQARLLAVGGVR